MRSYGTDLQDKILQAGQQDVMYMETVHRLQQDDSTGTCTCSGTGIGTCSGIGIGTSVGA